MLTFNELREIKVFTVIFSDDILHMSGRNFIFIINKRKKAEGA